MWSFLKIKFIYTIFFTALLALVFVAPGNELIGSLEAKAAPEHIVFGVKTEIPMADGERPRRDFYVNIGSNAGVKVGSVLDVFRSITSSDNLNNRNAHGITFKFAKLRIIHAESDMSVGRIIEVLPPAKTPIGEYPTVIVGDSVAIADRR